MQTDHWHKIQEKEQTIHQIRLTCDSSGWESPGWLICDGWLMEIYPWVSGPWEKGWDTTSWLAWLFGRFDWLVPGIPKRFFWRPPRPVFPFGAPRPGKAFIPTNSEKSYTCKHVRMNCFFKDSITRKGQRFTCTQSSRCRDSKRQNHQHRHGKGTRTGGCSAIVFVLHTTEIYYRSKSSSALTQHCCKSSTNHSPTSDLECGFCTISPLPLYLRLVR